jgi:hypothetical protein
MKLDDVLSSLTLRQMGKANELWRQHVGPEGPKLSTVAAVGEDHELYSTVLAAYAAAKMWQTNPAVTIDEALDMPLEVDDDPEPTGANNGGGPRPSRVSGA